MFLKSVSSPNNQLTNFTTPETKVLNTPEFLVKILSNLDNIYALANASLVCKNWKKVIADHQAILFRLDLFPRLNNESSFLREYNFIYRNVDNFEEADFYLVGERHSSQFCRELCGCLISRLATYHHVIVLVEGSTSMKNITENFELLIKDFYIHPTIKEKITFIGWDAENLDKEMGNSPTLHCWLLKEDIKCLDMILELEQKINEICPDLSEDKLLKLSVQNLEIILELTQTLNKITEWQKIVRIELEKGCATEKDAKRTFPQRTSNMSKTLNAIQSLLFTGKFVGKVVLNCGAEHLRVAQKNIGIQEYQLDELYQTLSQLKAFVMIPNKIDAID